jgi:hypothetical protein
VIQFSIEERKPEQTAYWENGYLGCLVLNGQLIEDSLVRQYKGRLVVEVYETDASTLLMQYQLAEIAEQFIMLRLQLPEAPSEYFNVVCIRCADADDIETLQLQLRFIFATDGELWAKSWSITDFVSTLKRLVEDRGVPGLSYHQHVSPLHGGVSFEVELHTPEETVQQVLQRWLPIIRDVCEEAEAILTASTPKEALVALFRFAPEVKTVCEQYLLYFVQFLEDLGIQAAAGLQEQARGVLFTVIPESGPEVLERIREALDLYLRIPGSPEFDAEVTRHTDIAVQQYAANVLHLRSQLTLAHAILENKNATIEALQAANLQYKQLLGTNPRSQEQLASPNAGSTQEDETLLGGAITLTKYDWKGIQVNLAVIFRELRRRFKGGS